MKPLRVIVLVHTDLVPPDVAGNVDLRDVPWRTEFDVVQALREAGHEVRPLGVRDDLRVIREAFETWQPHIAFNLLEEFDGVPVYDQNVVSYLELLKLPYTGCNPRGLMLARDKGLSKKILHYHRVLCPEFVVVPRGRKLKRPRTLSFPLIVKSVSDEASLGISQASIVDDDERLRERIAFVHDNVGSGAIVERYIDGRELYVGVLGNRRVRIFPVWELVMAHMPDEARRIATARVKWSRKYQNKHHITSRAVTDLPAGKLDEIQHVARRVYRKLGLNGYARIDLRLDTQGRVFVLEANPNPQIARGEDFADSAAHAGVAYLRLLQRILDAGLTWDPTAWGT